MVSFALSFIPSLIVIDAICLPSIFKCKIAFSSQLHRFLFPIDIFFPSNSKVIPLPSNSAYFLTFLFEISLSLSFIIDLAIGWLDKDSPFIRISITLFLV